MWWRVSRKLSVDLVCIRHPLAEVAVHDCGYDGLDCLACLLDDGSCGCCEGVEVGADVLHFVSVARVVWDVPCDPPGDSGGGQWAKLRTAVCIAIVPLMSRRCR